MEPVRVHPGLLGLLATYLRILFSMFSKPRWRGGDTAPTLPTLQATFTQPTRVRPGVLQQFRMAAGWAKEAASKSSRSRASSASETADNGKTPEIAAQPDVHVEPHIPVLFLQSQTFRLGMAILARLPYQVMGCVVNRRAKYSLLKSVTVGDALVHSCQLQPTTRLTPGGHLEFDIITSSRRVSSGDLVWRCTLTMVLLAGSRRSAKAKAEEPAPAPGEDSASAPSPASVTATAMTLLPTALGMDSAAGREYASLDGDISPMHLWDWSARLLGFPRAVGNVHHVVAMLEVALATALGVRSRAGAQLPLPASLEAEFKSPVVLPARLHVWAPKEREFAKLAHTPGGLAVSIHRAPSRLVAAAAAAAAAGGAEKAQADRSQGKPIAAVTLRLGAGVVA